MMGLIGFIVGFLGFLLHQIIERLTDVRIERAREFLAVSNLCVSCLILSHIYLCFSSLFRCKSSRSSASDLEMKQKMTV